MKSRSHCEIEGHKTYQPGSIPDRNQEFYQEELRNEVLPMINSLSDDLKMKVDICNWYRKQEESVAIGFGIDYEALFIDIVKKVSFLEKFFRNNVKEGTKLRENMEMYLAEDYEEVDMDKIFAEENRRDIEKAFEENRPRRERVIAFRKKAMEQLKVSNNYIPAH